MNTQFEFSIRLKFLRQQKKAKYFCEHVLLVQQSIWASNFRKRKTQVFRGKPEKNYHPKLLPSLLINEFFYQSKSNQNQSPIHKFVSGR